MKSSPTIQSLVILSVCIVLFRVFPAMGVEVVKLTPADGERFDYFGTSAAVSGDTAVIGAYGDDEAGAVYLFQRTAENWTGPIMLTPDHGTAHDNFGYSVSISGDYVAVGAYGDDDNGQTAGAVYIYKRTDAEWVQEAKLIAGDGAAKDFFGYSVHMEGGDLVVGAYGDDDKGSSSGAAYIFKRTPDEGWVQKAKLTPDDGSEEDCLGSSVSISGERVVIGAPGDGDNGISSGAAYVFGRISDAVWVQQVKLMPEKGSGFDYFGNSVAISVDHIIVGAFGDNDMGSFSGAAYIFNRISDAAWEQQVKLTPDAGARFHFFGSSVAISGRRAMVGSYAGSGFSGGPGSAYLFSRTSDTIWEEQAMPVPEEGSHDAWQGISVSVSEYHALVGASRDSESAQWAGATYAYTFSSPLVAESISATPETGPFPLDTLLAVSASGGAPPYTYSWEFGDGENSSEQNPLHRYEDAGAYTPQVTVIDANGSMTTGSMDVVVEDRDCPDRAVYDSETLTLTIPFAYSPSKVFRNLVLFPACIALFWASAAMGTHETKRWTTGVTDSADSTSPPLVIESISVIQKRGGFPMIVEFSASVSGGTGIYQIQWDYGDGRSTIGETQGHHYEHEGAYTVELIVFDSARTLVTATMDIEVKPLYCPDLPECPDCPDRAYFNPDTGILTIPKMYAPSEAESDRVFVYEVEMKLIDGSFGIFSLEGATSGGEVEKDDCLGTYSDQEGYMYVPEIEVPMDLLFPPGSIIGFYRAVFRQTPGSPDIYYIEDIELKFMQSPEILEQP